MELPICTICGLSPIAAHLWGDDDWNQYALPECPGLRLPRFVNRLLYRRRPLGSLVAFLQWLGTRHEAWLETVWPMEMRRKMNEVADVNDYEMIGVGEGDDADVGESE